MRHYARSPLVILRSSGTGPNSLSKRVTFLQGIFNAIAQDLPAAASAHVGVADFCDGTLLLIVDSGAWATRLRFEQNNLRRALAQKLRLDLDHIEIRVCPPVQESPPPPRMERQIPASARRQLAETARYIGDTKLADALGRLARIGNS